MQDEITVRPLVDILSEQLGEQVVMSGEGYVLFKDKSVVATAAVDLAIATQQNDFTAAQAEKAISDLKTNGELYLLNGTDYRVPFMKDDADGLLQVKAAFDMGVLSTNIHFSNGTIMPIASTEFAAFAMWFIEKRNSFFV